MVSKRRRNQAMKSIKIMLFAALAVSSAATAFADVPTVMNIVNFVRGNEPRYPDIDLVEPLREEIALNTKYHLPNTILLQYDALLRDDIVQTAKGAEQDKTEYGIWLEMCRQLVEKVVMEFEGVTYSVSYNGDLKPSLKGWTLHPIRGKAQLFFNK